jgi:hypothetical protein
MRYIFLLPVGMLTFLTLGIGLGPLLAPEHAQPGDITALPFGVIGVGLCLWIVWPWMMGNDND